MTERPKILKPVLTQIAFLLLEAFLIRWIAVPLVGYSATYVQCLGLVMGVWFLSRVWKSEV